MKGAPAHLENFDVILFLVPEVRAGDAAAQLDESNPMGLIGSGSRSQVAALNHQKQGDHSCRKGQYRQRNTHNGLTHNGQHRQREFYCGRTNNGSLVLANQL